MIGQYTKEIFGFFLKQDFAFFSQEKDLVVIKVFTSIKFMN